jgi:hypothetical protein
MGKAGVKWWKDGGRTVPEETGTVPAETRHDPGDENPENPDVLANMSGTLTDGEGNPIEDAEAILINETNSYTVTTDEDGDLYFEGIAQGSYILTIKYYGKKPITDLVEVSSNDEINRDYVMENDLVMP